MLTKVGEPSTAGTPTKKERRATAELDVKDSWDVNSRKSNKSSNTRKNWNIRERRQHQAPELVETPLEGMLTTAGTPTKVETTTTAGNQRRPTAAITLPTAKSPAKQSEQ